jgi:hypothetical protein
LDLNSATRDIFGQAVAFAVFENAFDASADPALIPSYYTSPDCSGQGYSTFDTAGNLPRVAMMAQSPLDPNGYIDVGIWFGAGPLEYRPMSSRRYYQERPPYWTSCEAVSAQLLSAPMNVWHETFKPPFHVIATY